MSARASYVTSSNVVITPSASLLMLKRQVNRYFRVHSERLCQGDDVRSVACAAGRQFHCEKLLE